MLEPDKKYIKLIILGGIITLTLGIHYGWLIEPIFGHVHWLHAIHGRFCYVPIVVAAAWFGLRGGLYVALLISTLILPYVLGSNFDAHELTSEIVEIIFYFAIAFLAGALIEKEFRARQKAEIMRLQLERSQKMSLVGRIAAGMAHEIKNPLASIKGAVEILNDDSTLPEDHEEFKSIIFKEIKRINASIVDFLEFARPSEPQMKSLNLADMIGSSLKQVQIQAQKQNILIVSDIKDSVLINGDQEKIHQVILNLLLNAIDASNEATIISVTLRQELESSQALIIVEDNGEGIAESDLGRIFEPFFTTKASGTGLGLAIARNIIEMHSGTISLRNKPDRGGAVAEIQLPLIQTGVSV